MTAANPANRQASPATMSIFGAAGDLAVPTLYNLVRAGRLLGKFSIIGIDHNARTTKA
jgi:glucose-6-phosphate 1-dehydrogenase